MTQKLNISDIKIENRFRKDLGDLQPLADSIKKVGLLQPIGVTPDTLLVFGQRRLIACRDILKWKTIPIRQVDPKHLLDAQIDENVMRKDFSISERVAIGETLRGFTHGGDRRSDQAHICDSLTMDRVAKRVGLKGEETYRRARLVVEKGAPELVEAMDNDEVSISAAAELVKQVPDHREQVDVFTQMNATNRLTISCIKQQLGRDLNTKLRKENRCNTGVSVNVACLDAICPTIKEVFPLHDEFEVAPLGSVTRRIEIEKDKAIDGAAKKYWQNRKDSPINSENPYDLFPTPPHVTEALLEREKFEGLILEPASGDGAMTEVLRQHGYKVQASDISRGKDFLTRQKKVANIVTNPPYTQSRAEQFVRKALELAEKKVALLLPYYFLEGVQRHELFVNEEFPVKAVYVYSRRPTFGDLSHSAPFGSLWVVWDRSHKGKAEISWIL